MQVTPTTARLAVLALSAAGLIGIAVSEGFESVARPPVPGDVPTGGFGSTRTETTGPMQAGERIDPVRGLILLQRDAAEAERIVRRCAPVPMHQHEFDAFVSLAYNVGPGKAGVKDGFCELKRGGPSTIVRRLLAGDYAGACRAILDWDKFQGRPLRGLTLRRERESTQCLGGTP
ncbi:glycoside hydrolase family protein [Melaminivora sp.]|uniref:glycoside hydrolase family protein n=1 Tax=Melaminivora sp. TaxID=1933032 RepID=UPI0028AA205F|nr:glycoside hydrolase family protein [Melaminivora sp.]